MDLKQFQVSPIPVVKEVAWKDVSFTIQVKKLSFGEIDQLDFREGDERSWRAAYIAAAVGLDDGKERFTYEQAYRLKPSLQRALMEAIATVNETAA